MVKISQFIDFIFKNNKHYIFNFVLALGMYLGTKKTITN